MGGGSWRRVAPYYARCCNTNHYVQGCPPLPTHPLTRLPSCLIRSIIVPYLSIIWRMGAEFQICATKNNLVTSREALVPISIIIFGWSVKIRSIQDGFLWGLAVLCCCTESGFLKCAGAIVHMEFVGNFVAHFLVYLCECKLYISAVFLSKLVGSGVWHMPDLMDWKIVLCLLHRGAHHGDRKGFDHQIWAPWRGKTPCSTNTQGHFLICSLLWLPGMSQLKMRRQIVDAIRLLALLEGFCLQSGTCSLVAVVLYLIWGRHLTLNPTWDRTLWAISVACPNRLMIYKFKSGSALLPIHVRSHPAAAPQQGDYFPA